MNYKLLLPALLLCMNSFGQQVINGGMEQWDTAFTPFPESWLTNAFFASHLCNPYIPLTAERTTERNTGNYAVKLEAKECIDDFFQPRIYMGFLAYGNTDNPNLAHGIPYNQRPEQLNFFYKFSRAGTDTAFVKIILRSLDGSGYAGQIIGEGKTTIINNTNVYTQLSVPVNYMLPDTPDIMQIVFATSKIAEQEYFELNKLPGNRITVGTTLWIDDITVSGNATGISEYQQPGTYTVFPNPVNHLATIAFENTGNKNHTLNIYDAQGRLTKTVDNIITDNITFDGTNFVSGIYFFQLSTESRLVATGKFIVE